MSNEVSDRPVELWIKVVGLVALFTFPLIGTIGTIFISGQNDTNKALSKMSEMMSQYNTELQIVKTITSRNSEDIKINKSSIGLNSSQIYNLKGLIK